MKHFLSIMAALICAVIWTQPVHAANEPEASMERINWGEAPSYIQTQAKSVVMHCSAGEYTPNQVQIYHFSNAEGTQDNYVLDFAAMKGLTQQIPGCNYNSPVCGPNGCFVMAYTQIDKKTWDQSWFGPALKIKIIAIEQKGKTYPTVEVTQSAESCQVVNGGKGTCPMHFTWMNNKFKYFGYAKLEDIIGTDQNGNPSAAVMPIIPPSPDEPAAAPVVTPPAPPAAAPASPAEEVPSAAPLPPPDEQQ